MNIEAIRHKDVKGKEMLYVLLTNKEQEVFINVGKKTFEAVEKLMSEEGSTWNASDLDLETEKEQM